MDFKISIIPYMAIHGIIDIWAYFFVHNSAIFDAFLKEILFMAGKSAWPPRWCPGVWELKTRPKSWPYGRTFWVNRYL